MRSVFEYEAFEDYERDAVAYLMGDGSFRVPWSRYGRDTSDCAPIAAAVRWITAHETGEDHDGQLDDDMGLVVNDHDDVAYMIAAYGPEYGIDPEAYLDDDEIAPYRPHWHVVSSTWSDDNEDRYWPIVGDVIDAAARVAEVADSEADYWAETAEIRADDEDYREAWQAHKMAEHLGVLAQNAGRFERYRRSDFAGDDVPVLFADDEATALKSARWTLGLEPGHNGETQDLGPIDVWECTVPCEYVR